MSGCGDRKKQDPFFFILSELNTDLLFKNI